MKNSMDMIMVVALAGLLALGGYTAEVREHLRDLVNAAAAEPEIPGVLLAVIGPEGFEWVGAAGVAEVAGATELIPDAPARLASNTKTYVATTTLRLVEEGELELDAPIANLLVNEVVDLLAADGYAVDRITVRHLLTHSGGLADHAATDHYMNAVFAEPQRQWTRREQIEGLVQWADPVAAPGELFSYSDTGYVLLGSIIERVKGCPLADTVRDLLGFGPLGLKSTWWERAEARPAGVAARAHQYSGTVDIHDWDPSCDLYGGGGLVATVEDLARFWGALFRGEIFKSPDTLRTLLSTPLESGNYHMGLRVHRFDEWTLYEHSGFWGIRAGYVPELDLAVAGVVTQQVGGEDRALKLIVDAIRIVAEPRVESRGR